MPQSSGCTTWLRALTSWIQELADRMTIHDAAGAEAALARVEAHVLGIASARTFINDPEACWRAVGARGLVRDEDRDGRVRAFVDPEPADPASGRSRGA